MNNNVNIQEKTEVNGVFCPFINGKCRTDCALFDSGAECTLSKINDLFDSISEILEEVKDINFELSDIKRLQDNRY